MKKKRQNNWQKHLKQLEHETSADYHFINEFGNYKNQKFELQNDFFDAPLVEETFDKNIDEGQLTLDVFETKNNLVIQATVAGVDPKDLDIALNNDVLTIRGERKRQSQNQESQYFYQECYWGKFSRSIVLPSEIKTDKLNAQLQNGLLTIILPKSKNKKHLKINVKQID